MELFKIVATQQVVLLVLVLFQLQTQHLQLMVHIFHLFVMEVLVLMQHLKQTSATDIMELQQYQHLMLMVMVTENLNILYQQAIMHYVLKTYKLTDKLWLI
jgi:hypothetical protein